MLPRKPTPKRIVAIPSNLFIEKPLREKSVKTGFVARALAIFRIEHVILYGITNEKKEKENALTLKKILEYMECPQYLKSKLFKKDPVLRYVGLLPPLRTPHHPLKHERTPYRDGVVVARRKAHVVVDVGLEKPLEISTRAVLKIGERVSVRLSYGSKGKISKADIVKREEIDVYWGYRVDLAENLLEAIKKAKADLVVATSRRGTLVNEIMDGLIESIRKSRKMLLLFGSQKEGLFEISERIGLNLEDIADYIVNFIPEQGTATVRTEEAMIASLSLINFLDTLKAKS